MYCCSASGLGALLISKKGGYKQTIADFLSSQLEKVDTEDC